MKPEEKCGDETEGAKNRGDETSFWGPKRLEILVKIGDEMEKAKRLVDETTRDPTVQCPTLPNWPSQTPYKADYHVTCDVSLDRDTQQSWSHQSRNW